SRISEPRITYCSCYSRETWRVRFPALTSVILFQACHLQLNSSRRFCIFVDAGISLGTVPIQTVQLLISSQRRKVRSIATRLEHYQRNASSSVNGGLSTVKLGGQAGRLRTNHSERRERPSALNYVIPNGKKGFEK